MKSEQELALEYGDLVRAAYQRWVKLPYREAARDSGIGHLDYVGQAIAAHVHSALAAARKEALEEAARVRVPNQRFGGFDNLDVAQQAAIRALQTPAVLTGPDVPAPKSCTCHIGPAVCDIHRAASASQTTGIRGYSYGVGYYTGGHGGGWEIAPASASQTVEHEWMPNASMMCCSCGESCHTHDRDNAEQECKKWHADHVASVTKGWEQRG